MNLIVEINLNRLEHLMNLFGMSGEELLQRLNVDLKRPLKHGDVFNDQIKMSLLKKIDSIFNKGLSYYLDPKNPTKSKEESIFFRKDNFNAELSLGAKQIVNKYEEEKLAFSTLAKLSDFKLKRKLQVYSIQDNPKLVAHEVRKIISLNFHAEKREFLKHFIERLADINILVFEFVETHNKIEKANINGLFLTPNVIVLKRNQKSLSREIFTLAHELGHYALNEEEIDDNIDEVIFDDRQLSAIEIWCNNFAYHFLIGENDLILRNFETANAQNDYHREIIDKIARKTHLSTISLYTRLLLTKLISPLNYRRVVDDILESIRFREETEKARLEVEKQRAIDEGRKQILSVPKPIISPLYLKTMQTALYSGLINEAEFCKKLNVNPLKIDKYL